MFEAVGESYWPTYFGKLRDCLKPGGVAGLQIITIADATFPTYRKGVDFIQRYIFPGGMLPSSAALKQQVTAAGLRSEEHTSELQSLMRISYAVFCLKKKNNKS